MCPSVSSLQQCVRPRSSTSPYRVRHCSIYSILCCPANETPIKDIMNAAPVVIEEEESEASVQLRGWRGTAALDLRE